jgi:outer membrane protein assembly factor BamB
MVGPDLVYANRHSQVMVALTPPLLTEAWRRTLGPGAYSSNASAFQQRVYFLGQNQRIQCVNAATGALIRESEPFPGAGLDTHIACDEGGNVYVATGGTRPDFVGSGTITAFAPDLARIRWQIDTGSPGRGSLAIGRLGTLIYVTPQEIVAIRNNPCIANFNGGDFGVQDLFDYITAWSAGHLAADVLIDNQITTQDLFDFVTLWTNGCL